MRTVTLFVLLVLAVQTAAAGAPSNAMVTQATETLVDAVVAPKAWEAEPAMQPPCVPRQVKLGLAQEMWNNPEVQASYTHLAATERSFTASRAIEELEEEKAAWCLSTGLCHPNAEVRVKCAMALLRLQNAAPARFVLDVADAFSVQITTGENAKLNGQYQHALCTLLNSMTGTSVALKDGQDADGLRAALPRWKQSLRERSGPIKRSDKDRKAIEEIKKNVDGFVMTVTLAPKPQGQWDPAFDLTTVVLSGGPTSTEKPPVAPSGKPTLARAQLTPEQVELLLGTLADNGYFDNAQATAAERSDRYCRIAISEGDEKAASNYIVDFDWKSPMAQTLDAIQDSLDGEPARLMCKLTAPIASQKIQWQTESLATTP